MKKSFSLKDHLFNREQVEYLGDLFLKADRNFKKDAFAAKVMTKLLRLELKERIVWIAEVLERHLSTDFKKSSILIIKALPEPLDPTKTDNDFGSFIFAPLGEYVVRNGLQKSLLPHSFDALLEITQRFSMEDSIRYFINSYPEETLEMLTKWVTHPHYHVRRLVSEGTRPLLPWSGRISIDSKVPLEYLDMLHADTTRYVTRSVANHLNDISKKHPNVALGRLKQWRKAKKQKREELEWMTRHSLRTLIKQGNRDALSLLGYESNPKISVNAFSLGKSSKKISLGNTLEFSFSITASEDCLLMIDYVIDFVKANGSSKPKVFKIKKLKMKKGETVNIKKMHKLHLDATTFTVYPGKHSVSLQINGMQFDPLEFIVV